jgi:DNA polymerase V
VTFLDLVPADRVQGGLFDRPDDARSMRRMRAIDQLNARFGRGAVAFGTAGVRPSWGLRREFISPRYTTVWDELLRV